MLVVNTVVNIFLVAVISPVSNGPYDYVRASRSVIRQWSDAWLLI